MTRFIRHVDRIKAGNLATAAYVTKAVSLSRTITFAAPNSTLTNFPVLVRSNSTFRIATSTGYDVHFQDMSGNELSYELDYYDPVTGNGAWWVLIPSLPSSDTTSIKMLYGNKGASIDGSSPLTVWSDYAAVYHFNELDYSYQTNRATGTQSVSGIATANSMSFQSVTGGTGRVLRFTHPGTKDDHTQAIVTANVSYSDANYSVMELWNYTSNTRNFCIFSPDISGVSPVANQNGGNENTSIMIGGNGSTNMRTGNYPNWADASGSSLPSGITLFGASFSKTNYRYAQINAAVTSGNNGLKSSSYAWNNYSTFLSLVSGWAGATTNEVDEIRACKTAHSQDWMAYEYSNYVDHANNVTYGTETAG